MPSLARMLSELPPSPLVAVDQRLRGYRHSKPVALYHCRTYFEPLARPRARDHAEFGIAAHEHAPPRGTIAATDPWSNS